MTFDQFRLRFPEFGRIPDPRIKDVLAAATLRVDATVWGTLAAEGIGYLAAHMLVASALDPKTKVTLTYEKEYKRIMRSVTSGFRVA